MLARKSAALAVIFSAVLIPVILYSQSDAVKSESVLSVLRIGQEVTLRQVGGSYEIRVNAPWKDKSNKEAADVAPESCKVGAVGNDFVMIEERFRDRKGDGRVAIQNYEHWIPLSNIRAVIRKE